ncbi:hypothetical protein FRACYDRAFT_238240 [Fragilariopsis cylindrus CCMP1102]|uniref:Uncharacterized protein n=1 Tax=Fragilariopsis cylindrus CCMP1102 TaxID=635003 RepID=A0A1E7FI57_9STRA|nr:hypothetical protein FRACYDRAFT_238240 [Fragilariopsis cylindrus CCMP1102]|eukprot:OEU17814.1 hypothetical protein FRACYDRAFT_238240 [Fragilariopsis cylindrus CCMP1102]
MITKANNRTRTNNNNKAIIIPSIAVIIVGIVLLVVLSPPSSSSTSFIRVAHSFSTTTHTTTTTATRRRITTSIKTTKTSLSRSRGISQQRQQQVPIFASTTTTPDNNNWNNNRYDKKKNNNNNSSSSNRSKSYRTTRDRKEQEEREKIRRGIQNKLRKTRDSILYYGQADAKKGVVKVVVKEVVDVDVDGGRQPQRTTTQSFSKAIVSKLVQSYSSALITVSNDGRNVSNRNNVLEDLLLDPLLPENDLKNIVLLESRPVQERILGLLAVLIQATTYIQEEISTSNNNKPNDHLCFIQSQLWKTCRLILQDMVHVVDNDSDSDRSNSLPHVVSPIAVTALAKALRESSTIKTKSYPANNAVDKVNSNFGAVEIKELLQLVSEARVAVAVAVSVVGKNNKDDNNGDMDRSLSVAWNLYLSSLCDRALATENPNDTGLEMAANLIIQQQQQEQDPSSSSPIEEKDYYTDIASYNTVLNIAAKIGNSNLVNTLWKDLTVKRGRQLQQIDEMKQQQQNHHQQKQIVLLQPNSRTYNTRLMVTKDPAKRLEIFDREIVPTALRCHREIINKYGTTTMNTVLPAIIDSFTIDLVMMPLLQADRKRDLFRLIDQWMVMVYRQHIKPKDKRKNNGKSDYQKLTEPAERTFKNALSAFFITLVQRNGDARTARELWDRYMVLEIDTVVNNNSDDNNNDDTGTNSPLTIGRTTNIVPPEQRHYNILLDGYARLVDRARDEQDHDVMSSLSSGDDLESDPNIKMASTRTMEADGDYDYDSIYASAKHHRDIEEQAIQDGQDLFALMMAHQQQRNSRNKVGPDAYTRSTMIRLCRTGAEVQYLLERASAATSTASAASKTHRAYLPRAVVRAAVTTCGRLGDPSMACIIFDQYMFPPEGSKSNNDRRIYSNYRAFNVLLGALAAGAKMENPKIEVTEPTTTEGENDTSSTSFLSQINGLTCLEAVIFILNLMTAKNSQTYCVAASALQYATIDESKILSHAISGGSSNDNDNNGDKTTSLALQIFRIASRAGIQADGRFVNAIFRCYGDDIVGALDGWKKEIRKATTQNEDRRNLKEPKSAVKNKNMLAAYNGLIYVCGRAERPDIAVRIVYAMKNKEGLEPNENPYYNYRSGKRTRISLIAQNKQKVGQRGLVAKLLPKLDMVGQYENVLYVECKQYDSRDRRTENERKVRIIV